MGPYHLYWHEWKLIEQTQIKDYKLYKSTSHSNSDKINEYKDLDTEIENMWHILHVTIEVLGMLKMWKNIKKISRIHSLQQIILYGTVYYSVSSSIINNI